MGKNVTVLHQEEGGIGTSIPDAQDFPRPERFSRVEGNVEGFPAAMGFAP